LATIACKNRRRFRVSELWPIGAATHLPTTSMHLNALLRDE
jgi:hypothetical protein